MEDSMKQKIDAVQKVKEDYDLKLKNINKMVDKGLMNKQEETNNLKELEEYKTKALKEVEYEFSEKQNYLEQQKLMDIEKANSDEMIELTNAQAEEKQRYMQEFVSDEFMTNLLAGDKER